MAMGTECGDEAFMNACVLSLEPPVYPEDTIMRESHRAAGRSTCWRKKTSMLCACQLSRTRNAHRLPTVVRVVTTEFLFEVVAVQVLF